MTASISAACGLKGLPGPTGRGVHRGVALQHERPPLVAHGTCSKTLVLLLKGGTYLETGKHDTVGKVQMSTSKYSTSVRFFC